MRRITAQELLRLRNENNKTVFKEIHLSNQSFQGKDLSRVQFIRSKISGCNFQDANLREARFIESEIGISLRQHIAMLVYGPLKVSDVPYPIEDFVFSLCFAVPWTFAAIIVFTILSITLISEAQIGSTISDLSVVGVLIFLSLTFFDIRKTLSKYKASKTKSICSNFRNAALEGITFYKTSVKNCDFYQCSLVNGALQESRLINSDFSDSNLKGVSLRKSELINTKFSLPSKVIRLMSQLDAKYEDLRGINLSGFDLSGVNLKGADLTGANLVSSILKNAILEEATMERCDARSINLEGANLTNANLLAADLSIANLSRSSLNHANLAATRMMGARLEEADLTGACIASWQISDTDFKQVRCRYIFLSFSHELGKYTNRIPENDRDYLNDGEFEGNISQAYKIMAQVLQNGAAYTNEIKKELEFIERSPQDEKSLKQSLDRLKQLVESLDQKMGEVSGSPISVMVGQILSSAGDMKMSGNFFKTTSGGSSHDNVIQSDNISGNSTISQSTSASWSSQDENTRESIIAALEEISKTLSVSSLTEEEKEATKPYIDVAKNEAKKEKPRKEKIIENIEEFKGTVESLNTTTDTVKSLVSKLRSPCAILAKTLGLAFSFLP